MNKKETRKFLSELADILDRYDAHIIFGITPWIDAYGRDHGIVIKNGDKITYDPNCWTITAQNIYKELGTSW